MILGRRGETWNGALDKHDVCVLGSGPAGLAVVHAAVIHGYNPVILSRLRKSELYGAQYLHTSLPDVPCGTPVDIDYTLSGTVEGYRTKVYGPESDVTVSPESLAEHQKAWDIRKAYDWLWGTYHNRIADVDLRTPGLVEHAIALGYKYIFSTVPLPVLCRDSSHTFASERILAAGDAPERGIEVPFSADENTVICSGDPEVQWYRVSNIFGYKTVEWPYRGFSKPPWGSETASIVRKPLDTDCDCWWNDIYRVGRYGAWHKGLLVSDAFNAVMREMSEAHAR